MDLQIQRSLAFDIFSEIGSEKPIYESPREVGFNKANAFIEVQDLSLVGRRVVNGVLCIAAQKPDEARWDMDLDFFKWLIAYPSRNNVPLKRALREAQKSAAVVSIIDTDAKGNVTGERWGSVPLLGTVVLAGGRIVFEMPQDIRNQLKDPRSFTFLSLRISAALDTIYSAVMYERLSKEQFRGRTEMISIDEFREWFGKNDSSYLKEFRYLRREVLTPSIERINSETDIKVTMETRAQGGGRRVTHLVFKVEENPDGRYALRNIVETSNSQQLIYDLVKKEFGLSQNFISEMVSNRDEWTREYIMAAVTLTRYRMQKGLEKGDKVKSPGGYLMKALREGWTLSEHEVRQMNAEEARTVRQGETQKNILAAKEKKSVEEIERNLILKTTYENLDTEKQNKVFREFKSSPAFRGIEKTIMKTAPDLNAQNVFDYSISKAVFLGFLSSKETIILESGATEDGVSV